jgi:hypothetical protein
MMWPVPSPRGSRTLIRLATMTVALTAVAGSGCAHARPSAPSSAAAAATRACDVGTARVLAQDGSAIVFGRHSVTGNNAPVTYYYDVEACSAAHPSPVRLDDPEADELIRVPRIVGGVVAFEVTGSDGEDQYSQLARADISKPLSESLVLAEAGCYACGIFTDVAITSRGTVAFIEKLTKGSRVGGCARPRCSGGKVVALDRGSKIALRSLSVRGDTATWMNGPTRRSASLP